MPTRTRRTPYALLLALLLGATSGLVQANDAADAQGADQAEEAYDPDVDGERRAKSAGASLIGQPGPDVTVTTLDGERIDLAELYGQKPVYLKFWATWCVPCRQQMPGFQEIHETHGDEIEVIAVNTGFSDTAEAARNYREELGLGMSITVDDGTLAEAFNLRVTPQHVLIDRSGRVAYVGYRDDQAFEEALQGVLDSDAGRQGPVQGDDIADVDALGVGDPVEGLSVTTLAGDELDLAARDTGKPLGMVFFSPWCESYLAESQPETSQACRRVRETVNGLSERDDVDWVGVSSGLWASDADLEAYRETTEVATPLALDASGDLYRAFGVQQIPSVVLIDRDGMVARKLGPQDRELDEAVETVLAD